MRPRLGLVCITRSEECRYRALTRARLLTFPAAKQQDLLLELYWDNLSRLHRALSFCRRKGIGLYRVTSSLFPFSDEPLGRDVLRSIASNLSAVGRRAERLRIRVLAHPDQFVVLNSESPKVVATSELILEKHALAFDLMGLPRSPWSALILHGGKAGRADALVERIAALPEGVRSRLVLENDEYAYGAAEILNICRRAGVPMVFDAHHHVVKERLETYEHPSIRKLTEAAGGTWPRPGWQIVHLSNGKDSFGDRHHSDFITSFPTAFARVPWIEVEARAKDEAIERLRSQWPAAD